MKSKILLFVCLLGIIFILKSCMNVVFDTNKPKRLEDATNREIRDFLKWEEKQRQYKYDNEKFFK